MNLTLEDIVKRLGGGIEESILQEMGSWLSRTGRIPAHRVTVPTSTDLELLSMANVNEAVRAAHVASTRSDEVCINRLVWSHILSQPMSRDMETSLSRVSGCSCCPLGEVRVFRQGILEVVVNYPYTAHDGAIDIPTPNGTETIRFSVGKRAA